MKLWSVPGFTPIMIAVAAAFGAWSLLLPVVPTHVLEAGGTPHLAGWSTGMFMAATVMTQMATPWLLRRWGYRPVMACAALMLGIPAIGHALGTDGWMVLSFSALRGIGFGALTVAEASIMTELVPSKYLGKATGLLGVFVGGSQMVFLPAGLSLAGHFGFAFTYLVAAMLGLIGFAVLFKVPVIRVAAETSTNSGTRRPVAVWKLVLVPAVALSTISMSYGAVSTFLPSSLPEINPDAGMYLGGIILSVAGGSAMVARYIAGALADHKGQAGTLYLPGQMMALAGVMLLAGSAAYGWGVWALMAAALLFGFGFGIAQQEALLSMFSRLPRHRSSLASAVWNIFFDAGTGVGAIVLAGVLASSGYVGLYLTGAAVIVGGLILTTVDMIIGRHRVVEYDNIKTRLWRMRKL
ncbi:MAG: MFS transporter [Corynebacterium sp.]|nr:MFS transporter [Corynebacterium sp.]